MVSTVIESTSPYGLFEHFDGIKYVQNMNNHFLVFDENLKPDLPINEVFISNREKFVFGIIDAPFHSMFDLFGNLINAINLNKDALFIIENSILHRAPKIFAEFLDIFLKKHEIEYVFVGKEFEELLIKINNFAIVRDKAHLPVPMPSNNIYEEFLYFIKNKNVAPHKKVYLSRKKYDSDKELDLSSNKMIGRVNGLRIDDEQKMEDFFKKMNFEIVYPEDFLTFEDQINYFYEVKTLVGITGTGLMNSIFMQPGSNILELVTYHVLPQHNEVNHENYIKFGEYILTQEHPYCVMANEKNHLYIAISNKDLKSHSLIKNIQNRKHLMNILLEK